MRENITRKCNGCTACCFGMKIEGTDSPSNTHCKNECLEGCSIYATRPDDCKYFECLWRLGLGEEKDRPDKIGMFLFLQPNSMFGDLICASEAYHGAFDEPRVREYLNKLAVQELQCLIYMFGDDDKQRRLIGPPELVQEAIRKINKDGRFTITEQHSNEE